MKHHGGLKWLLFAIVFIAIGWFSHQYIAHIATFVGNSMKTTTTKTEPLKKADEGEFCAQVITPARNPETGDIQEFPTTCSVPDGWERIENDIPDFDLQVQ
ncbi:hypothetical protein K2P56_00480 [Patescibacteria group bacterium]|nr:hypothetical protein [Patescibacteria group bacterium]